MRFILLSAVICLLASCSNENKITFTQIDSTHTKIDVPAYDSAGGRLPYNTAEKDTIYTVEPSGSLKSGYAWRRGDIQIAVGALLIWLALFYFFWYKPGNKGDDKPSGAAALCASILALALIVGGTTDWVRCNTAQTIKKPLYDSLINTHALDTYLRGRLK